jgi:hypothetical protein
MSNKQTYKCKNCGEATDVDMASEETPECCEAPMEKMPDMDACTVSTTAEHARLDETDEPCDDGRSGKIE